MNKLELFSTVAALSLVSASVQAGLIVYPGKGQSMAINQFKKAHETCLRGCGYTLSQ